MTYIARIHSLALHISRPHYDRAEVANLFGNKRAFLVAKAKAVVSYDRTLAHWSLVAEMQAAAPKPNQRVSYLNQ
jgi:hypothetical protein